MKKKTTIIAMAVAAVCSLLFFTGCKPHHQRGTFALDYISEVLDLTPEQENSLEAVRTELTEKIEQMHGDKEEMYTIVKAQLASDAIDKELVKQLISEHRTGMDEVIDLAVERLSTFHAELTPEQRDKLVAKFKKFEKHHSSCFHR